MNPWIWGFELDVTRNPIPVLLLIARRTDVPEEFVTYGDQNGTGFKAMSKINPGTGLLELDHALVPIGAHPHFPYGYAVEPDR